MKIVWCDFFTSLKRIPHKGPIDTIRVLWNGCPRCAKVLTAILSLVALAVDPSAASDPDKLPGMIIWLKADNVVADSKGLVQSWPDSSGNGNSFSQKTGRWRPRLVADAIDGKPAVRFTGSDFLDSGAIPGLDTNKLTVFHVFRDSKPARFQHLISSRYVFKGQKAQNHLRAVGLDGVRVLHCCFTAQIRLGGNCPCVFAWIRAWDCTPPLGTPRHCPCGTLNGDSDEAGLAMFAPPATSGRASAPTRLIPPTALGATCSKLIIYNRALSEEERQGVEKHLRVSYFNETPTYDLTVVDGSGSGSYAAGTIIVIAAAVVDGKLFDVWTGDIEGVSEPNAASTTLVMPAADVSLAATFKDASVDLFNLTVFGGSGSGAYAAGAVVPIAATAPDGKLFDSWTGDTVCVQDVGASSTTLTMPAAATTVIATFKDTQPGLFALTVVVGGTGSGEYAPGATVLINAEPPAGKVFDSWTGDTVFLADPRATPTILTMPAASVTVEAAFKDAPPVAFRLTVEGGTGSGSYSQGVSVRITTVVPTGKIFQRWTGGGAEFVDNSQSASALLTMPAADVYVKALFVDAPPEVFPLTVVGGLRFRLLRGGDCRHHQGRHSGWQDV